MMRAKSAALTLAGIIRIETDELPEHNFFGESNQKEKSECYAWVEALEAYAADGILPIGDDLIEVRNWITGENWSALSDYE